MFLVLTDVLPHIQYCSLIVCVCMCVCLHVRVSACACVCMCVFLGASSLSYPLPPSQDVKYMTLFTRSCRVVPVPVSPGWPALLLEMLISATRPALSLRLPRLSPPLFPPSPVGPSYQHRTHSVMRVCLPGFWTARIKWIVMCMCLCICVNVHGYVALA